jgi:hypothetical protein
MSYLKQALRRLILRVGLPATLMVIVALLPTAGRAVEATTRDVQCEHGLQSSSREITVDVCVVRDLLTHATRSLSVYLDSRGGAQITRWDRDDVLVRAKVRAWADDEEEARAIEKRIVIRVGNVVRAFGPNDRDGSWSVSYEIFVPRGIQVESVVANGYAFPTLFAVGLIGLTGALVFAYCRWGRYR